ncbi:DUF445 domain-containing protein [Longimicrobium terrae]|uniref:Uncharacterized membrane-anchored protein YjiN (DUF445 family) n=1 Tax=Longimicrobium terrae TaxID=1639882 RepID=A0A841GXX5_9BACT|nr:DUF445 domain-containing protein [Longimicrobium terrae]MBB6070597.1 uncharacterized membrane-anchored protein YjiN (DUF445 family) [Longimicrobium terrae]NNC29581.1 DUF445 domain-containing protein [Longimicrobium terrae]
MDNGRLSLPPLPDEELKRQQLDHMKRLATGLLAVATLIFIVARIYESRYPWLGYIRATAEAAMVGAVADWFAVTALFRHPMGIPIPHTAIIPTRKERIGRSLGGFVQNNFLAAPVITAKLRSANIAGKLAQWLADPAHGDTVGRHASAAVTGVVQVLRDEEVQEIITESLNSRVRKTQVAPLMGNVLSLVTAENRHQELLDSAIRLFDRLFEENRDALRDRIAKETPWWMPSAVDDQIYRKIANGIENTLVQVAADPDHPLRHRFNDAVNEFVERLKSSPQMIARGEELKEEILQHPAVRGYSASLWADMKASVLRHGANPESEFRRRVGNAATRLGSSLAEDQELLDKVNGWAEQALLYVVEQYRGEVADLIETTVAAWDPEDTTRKIELQIGRDLQYIRINGTLVGGLVGLFIYTVSQFFGG